MQSILRPKWNLPVTELTTSLWKVDENDFPADGSPRERASFLLRYAVLAPSSHNSQPWIFRIHDGRIDLLADPSRWLEVADSDKRELHLSVGCALENLLVAAEHFDLGCHVEYEPEGTISDLVARVHLENERALESSARRTSLFHAIPRRHTNHREYDGRSIPMETRRRLEALASEPGVEIHFTDDEEIRRRVDELTVEADAIQFADPEWRDELGAWLGRGVFGTNWLMSKMARLAVSHLNLGRSVGKKDRELLDSASLLGLVAADEESREVRVQAGQVFERLFLAATDAGLALQPMNQILQVSEVRDEFEALLPAEWGRPQITFRLGYAEPQDHTPRRPLEDVLG